MFNKKKLWLKFFALLTLMIGLALGALQLPWTKGLLTDKIEAQLSQKSGLPIKINSIGGFLPFRWDFYGLTIGESDALENLTMSWSPPAAVKFSSSLFEGGELSFSYGGIDEEGRYRCAATVRLWNNDIPAMITFHHDGSLSLEIDDQRNGRHIKGLCSIDRKNDTIQGTIDLTTTDPLQDATHIELSGALSSPKITIDLTAPQLETSGNTFSDVEAHLEALCHHESIIGSLNFSGGAANTPLEGSSQFMFSFKEKSLGLKKLLLEVDESHKFVGNILINSHTLYIENGHFENYLTGAEYNNISTSIERKGRQIHLTNFSAEDLNKGRITAHGTLDITSHSIPAINLKAQLKNTTIIDNDTASAIVSGKIALQGLWNNLNLSGDLKADQVKFTIPDRQNNNEIIALPVTYLEDSPTIATKAPANKLNIDLQLHASNGIFIKGRGLSSEWEGELHLKGSREHPLVNGKLSTLGGKFDFCGKTLAIKAGEITFAKEQAYISASSEVAADDAIIDITLQGPLSQLELSLSSTPSLSTNEILSRILFGSSAAEITPLQSLQLAQTIITLSEKPNSPNLIGLISNTLGFDRLGLGTYGSEQETSIEFGKYLTNGLFLNLNKSLESEGGNLSLEADFTRHIKFLLGVDDQSESKLSLQWHKDY
ncbi:MAG: translocation/assembly module TamB domain-containing protein [Chlamydiota bacterium]